MHFKSSFYPEQRKLVRISIGVNEIIKEKTDSIEKIRLQDGKPDRKPDGKPDRKPDGKSFIINLQKCKTKNKKCLIQIKILKRNYSRKRTEK